MPVEGVVRFYGRVEFDNGEWGDWGWGGRGVGAAACDGARSPLLTDPSWHLFVYLSWQQQTTGLEWSLTNRLDRARGPRSAAPPTLRPRPFTASWSPPARCAAHGGVCLCPVVVSEFACVCICLPLSVSTPLDTDQGPLSIIRRNPPILAHGDRIDSGVCRWQGSAGKGGSWHPPWQFAVEHHRLQQLASGVEHCQSDTDQGGSFGRHPGTAGYGAQVSIGWATPRRATDWCPQRVCTLPPHPLPPP